MMEESLFKVQDNILGSELLAIWLVNIEQSYKPPHSAFNFWNNFPEEAIGRWLMLDLLLK